MVLYNFLSHASRIYRNLVTSLMAGIGAGYDLSVSTFSPDGRIFQVEYATKGASTGNLIAGAICGDGIILIVEKLLTSKLVVPHTNTRIFFIDRHCFAAVSGFNADGREIVNRARIEAKNYRETVGERIPTSLLAERVAQFIHIYTLSWSERPLGSSILLAGLDANNEKVLYLIDPAGTCYLYKANAIGKNSQNVKTELEKIDFTNMTCEEVLKNTAKIILKSHPEAREKKIEFEMAWLCDSKHVVERCSTEFIDKVTAETVLAIESLEDIMMQD